MTNMTLNKNVEEIGKMFVGGLSWETTQESLSGYFRKFGEVTDSVVMKNPESGRSRGFGFVTFKDPNCLQIVLSGGPHSLDGRTIDPKSCCPKSVIKQQKAKGTTTNYPKIFLGGLPSTVTETDLRSFFSKYGKVMQVVIMYDQEKKRSRGFGFLSFETEEIVDRVCSEHFVTIEGKQVEVKKAKPREIKPDTPEGQTVEGGWGDIAAISPLAAAGIVPQPSLTEGLYENLWPSVTNQAYQTAFPGWGAAQAFASYSPAAQYSAQFAAAAAAAYNPYSYLWGATVPTACALLDDTDPVDAKGDKAATFSSYAAAYGLPSFPQDAPLYGPARPPSYGDESFTSAYSTETSPAGPIRQSAEAARLYGTRTITAKQTFHPYRR